MAEYPNHAYFKKTRLIKLIDVNYKCEICHEEAKVVHHIDGTKDNHAVENLKALCHKCHIRVYHSGHRHPYKGRKEYCKGHLRKLKSTEFI